MEKSSKKTNPASFWRWMLTGDGGRPGWRFLVGWHLIAHCLVGLAAAQCLILSPEKIASGAILPMSGVFVAVGFAWSINAYGMLSTPELRRLAKSVKGGLNRFVSPYQLVITLLLACAAIWGIVATGPYPVDSAHTADVRNSWVKFLLGFTTSLTFVEVWSVANSARSLLLEREEVSETEEAHEIKRHEDAIAAEAFNAGVQTVIERLKARQNPSNTRIDAASSSPNGSGLENLKESSPSELLEDVENQRLGQP